jgi:hypothetical protein
VVPCFRVVRSSFSVTGVSTAILFPAATSYLPCFALLAIIALPKPPCFGRSLFLTAASMKFGVFWDVVTLKLTDVLEVRTASNNSELHPLCFVCLLKRTYR